MRHDLPRPHLRSGPHRTPRRESSDRCPPVRIESARSHSRRWGPRTGRRSTRRPLKTRSLAQSNRGGSPGMSKIVRRSGAPWTRGFPPRAGLPDESFRRVTARMQVLRPHIYGGPGGRQQEPQRRREADGALHLREGSRPGERVATNRGPDSERQDDRTADGPPCRTATIKSSRPEAVRTERPNQPTA